MGKRKTCTLRMGYAIHDPAVDERIKRSVASKTTAQLEREAEERAADDIITALLRQAREEAQR